MELEIRNVAIWTRPVRCRRAERHSKPGRELLILHPGCGFRSSRSEQIAVLYTFCRPEWWGTGCHQCLSTQWSSWRFLFSYLDGHRWRSSLHLVSALWRASGWTYLEQRHGHDQRNPHTIRQLQLRVTGQGLLRNSPESLQSLNDYDWGCCYACSDH